MRDKIKKVLKRLKGSASPGPDSVVGWCYKHGGDFILDALYDCFNQSIDMKYASVWTCEAWMSPSWNTSPQTL